MKVYLASPGNQLQAAALAGMPALISFASYKPFLDSYVASFDGLLIDSGAYTAFTQGKKIDVCEYVDFVDRFSGIDAFAGLDDISGNWRQSLKNYRRGGFPTIHDSDPPELLNDLIPMARERGGWIGVGLVPPRSGRSDFLNRVLAKIPEDLHVHGWALREYRNTHQFGSVDSTNWWRDSFAVRKKLPWLTPSEALEIIVKRERREKITVDQEKSQMKFDWAGWG